MKKETLGYLLGIFAAFFYSLLAVFVKIAEDVNIETLVFFRNLISILFLLPLLYKNKFQIQTERLSLHFFRSIIGLVGLYTFFYAIKNLPIMNAVLLSNTTPLFVPLVVLVWLKLKIPKRRIFALFLGFLGVFFVLNPKVDFPLVPSLIGFSNGLFIATAMVSIRQLSKTEKTEVILFYFFSFSLIFSFVPMVIAWQPILSFTSWLYIILLGIVAFCYQVLLTKTYSYIPATKAACMIYLSVIFSGLFEWVLWKQIPPISVMYGSGLIVLGGVLVLLDKKQPIKMSQKPKKHF